MHRCTYDLSALNFLEKTGQMLPGKGGNFFLIRRNCDFGAPQEPAFEAIVVSAGMTCRHYEIHSA